MLDPELSKVLNIDPFTQYIMKELDRLEDELHTSILSPYRFIEARAQYNQLRAIRDEYAKYITNQKTK